MKVYFTVLITVLLTCVVYGLIAPALVSAKDTIAVIAGFALCVTYPAAVAASLKKIFSKKKEKDE